MPERTGTGAPIDAADTLTLEGPDRTTADTSGALAADVIAPRHLVPTSRQLTQGEAAETYGFEGPHAARKERALRRSLSGYLSRLDLRRIDGPKTPVVVFVLFAFFAQLIDSIFTVIGPELRTTFAAGTAAIGFVGVVFIVLQYAVAPFYGWLLDRVRRVHLVRLTYIGDSVASTASAFAANILGFVGIRSASGLLAQGTQAPRATLLADYYDGDSFGRAMSLVAAAPALTTVVGPVIGGLMVSVTNWRVAVFLASVLATAAALATFLLREPRRGEAERRALGVAEVQEEAPPLSFSESWRAARSIHTLRRIWYATPFLIATSSFPTFIVLALFLGETFGLGPTQRGYIAAVVGASGFMGITVIGPLAGRHLEHRPARIMTMAGGVMALQAVGMLVLGMSTWLPLAVVAAIPIGLGIALLPTLTQMVTLKVVPPRVRGLGYSTTAPWALLGLILFSLALTAPHIRGTVIVLVPFLVAGAAILATGAGSVERDIRAARASVLAERTAREAKRSGRAKLLVCRGVEVTYDGTPVLFGVDLDVQDGEILALLGTNGAGKSSLLRAISGSHHASNGAILLDGQDITHEPADRNASRGVVMMPGGRATLPTLTVAENLRTATWLYRDDENSVRQRLEQVLGFFPILRQRLDEAAGNLSGGEQQMVGLAQAFLMRPRLLMIDELSLGLAPSIIEQMLTILQAIHEQGATIILVEQSVNVALTIAKRAVFMEKGEIRFDGPTPDLLQRPDLVRSIFIGGATTAGAVSVARRSRPRERRSGTLDVQDVAVQFGGVQALRGVTLVAEPGEIVGVIGPNGAGKTTLFDVVSGFIVPDAGRVVFDGRDVTGLAPHERARVGIGRSFQHARLFPALTVRENVAVALERRTVRSEVMAALWLPAVRDSEVKVFERVEGLIEILGLEAFADKFAHELSTGTRRAVEVACMMAAEPQVLLLDEPSSGLAQAEAEALGPVLARLVRETGCALLMIEHDIPLISSIANRMVAMHLGAVVASGTPGEVLNNQAMLASYLAASERVIARSDAPMAKIAAALGQDIRDGAAGRKEGS